MSRIYPVSCDKCFEVVTNHTLNRHKAVCAKLPSNDKLKEMYKSGDSLRVISERFGVSASVIGKRVKPRKEEPDKGSSVGNCTECNIILYDRPNDTQALNGMKNHNGYCAMCAGKMAKDYHARYGVAGAIIAHEPTVKYNFVSPRGYII